MTSAEMTTVLDLAGVTPNSWVQIKSLNKINTISDSNVGILTTNLYYFDLNNSLVKVKRYKNVDDKLIAVTKNVADEYIDFEAVSSVTFGYPYRWEGA